MPVTWTTIAAIADGSNEGLIQAYGIASAVDQFNYSYSIVSGLAEVVGIATFKGTGIAYVQTKSAASSPVAVLTTPAMTSTSGNFIGVQTACNVRAHTITDSNANAWQTAWSVTSGPAGSCRYVENVNGGAGHTFTITPTGGTDYCALAASEFSGINASASLDKTVSTVSTAEPHTSGLTALTTQASELILAGGTSSHGSAVPVTLFIKHFINGGVDNNWSSDTNWSSVAGGPNDLSKPTAVDQVVFDTGSPNCTIDVAATCKSFTATAYTHTLAANASLTTAGNVILGTGMTITGTGDLILTVQTTVTSNGKTWSGGVQLLGGNATQFALGTFSVGGLFTCSTTGTSGAWVSGTITVAGGLLTNTICSWFNTPATFILTGGTWSGAGRMSNNLQFAGNVTISGQVIFTTAIMTYVSGVITTVGSTVYFRSSSISLNCAGMSFGTIRFEGLSVSIVTLLSALDAEVLSLEFTTVIFAGTAGMPITCRTISALVGGSFVGPVTASVALNIGQFSASVIFSGSYPITAPTCVVAAVCHVTVNAPIVITGVTTALGSWSFDGGTSTISTAGLDLSGAAAGTGVNVGRAITGPGTIILTGGILKTNAVDGIEANLQIAGNVTLVGTVLYGSTDGGGTITYVSGTISVGTSILSIYRGTLNTAGMSWANITLRGTTVTLASALVATGTLTYPNSAFTWVGAFNITVGTLTNVNPTATRVVTWVHGTTLTINTAFTIVHTGAGTIRLTWQTDLSGSTMQFIVMPGATINVKNVDPWDLDASAGQSIFTLNGVVHNSLNWSGVFTTVFVPSSLSLNPPLVFRVLSLQLATWIGDVGGSVWIE